MVSLGRTSGTRNEANNQQINRTEQTNKHLYKKRHRWLDKRMSERAFYCCFDTLPASRHDPGLCEPVQRCLRLVKVRYVHGDAICLYVCGSFWRKPKGYVLQEF